MVKSRLARRKQVTTVALFLIVVAACPYVVNVRPFFEQASCCHSQGLVIPFLSVHLRDENGTTLGALGTGVAPTAFA
jgi:hypothetical protein